MRLLFDKRLSVDQYQTCLGNLTKMALGVLHDVEFTFVCTNSKESTTCITAHKQANCQIARKCELIVTITLDYRGCLAAASLDNLLFSIPCRSANRNGTPNFVQNHGAIYIRNCVYFFGFWGVESTSSEDSIKKINSLCHAYFVS